MNEVEGHYSTGGPYERVHAALEAIAPGGATLSFDELGGFDEFHTGGRFATTRLGELLNPAPTDVVLDAGCGLGGPARYLADRYGCAVVGVDLTPDFIRIAELLNERTGSGDRVSVRVGDITALELDDDSVDIVWTQHVSMNVANKDGMYREFARVLRPGGRLGLFDVVAGSGDVLFPVPWATVPELSHLVTADELRHLLGDAGFTPQHWDEPIEPLLEAMRARLQELREEQASESRLHMQMYVPDLETRFATYLRNMEEGHTAIVMTVATLEG